MDPKGSEAKCWMKRIIGPRDSFGAADLGDVRRTGRLAVLPSGETLGLAHQTIWARPPQEQRMKEVRPIYRIQRRVRLLLGCVMTVVRYCEDQWLAAKF
jgi:hypothetical protein